jgi:hypothetical protein
VRGGGQFVLLSLYSLVFVRGVNLIISCNEGDLDDINDLLMQSDMSEDKYPELFSVLVPNNKLSKKTEMLKKPNTYSISLSLIIHFIAVITLS